MIRKAFIPRDGFQLAEFDFKSIEVCVGAAYHKDPQMVLYCSDPKTNDMHRDMACQLFKIKPEQITKSVRNEAKGDFVFSEFYGNYYKNVAKDLWDAVDREKLTLADGTPLRAHLRACGFSKLGACDAKQKAVRGTYEYFVKEVEEHFWQKRFPIYAKWKRDAYAEYQRTGGFSYLTGFYVEGILDRKQVANFPIQGTAAHCLIWVLIRLQRWLNKNNMRTLILGQIHDSIILDIWIPELDRVKRKIKQLVTERLPEYWKWINVPMVIEMELCEEKKAWFYKKGVEL